MSKIKFVLAIVFTLFATNIAVAGSCDQLEVPGMTDSQLIDLKKKCVDMSGTGSAVVSANNMAEYAELGKKYGIALSEVAKSIGTTVNELAQTPVGKVTTALIVWKLMGAQLIHVIGGILVWIVGFGCIRMFCKTIQSQDIQYSTTDKNIFGNYVIIKNKLSRLSEGEQIGVFLMNILVFVIGIVTLFSY